MSLALILNSIGIYSRDKQKILTFDNHLWLAQLMHYLCNITLKQYVLGEKGQIQI